MFLRGIVNSKEKNKFGCLRLKIIEFKLYEIVNSSLVPKLKPKDKQWWLKITRLSLQDLFDIFRSRFIWYIYIYIYYPSKIVPIPISLCATHQNSNPVLRFTPSSLISISSPSVAPSNVVSPNCWRDDPKTFQPSGANLGRRSPVMFFGGGTRSTPLQLITRWILWFNLGYKL